MVSLGDFIKVCMDKKKINSYSELLRLMNDTDDKPIVFKLEHLSELINGVTRHPNYIIRLEQVFDLEPNTLLVLAKTGVKEGEQE